MGEGLEGNIADEITVHKQVKLCDVEGCSNELDETVDNSFFTCKRDHNPKDMFDSDSNKSNDIDNEKSYSLAQDADDSVRDHCQDCVVKYWLRYHQTEKTSNQFKFSELQLPTHAGVKFIDKKSLTCQTFQSL